MSAGPGRREVAVRCFAAEYDDADYNYSESDEERAPNYVVTPTGTRINRCFVVGVLTAVEPVSDDVLRARVVDPTGAFVVYAGQYQPDAKAFLERAEPPAFVAVTGKARTFEPDDGDVVYTSLRPETVTAVDAATRDRWTVQAAEQTIGRVSIAAAALAREERGDALRAVLLEAGVDPSLAAGIPRAIDHYGTTPAYLAAIRELAVEAAEVVAGGREEVSGLAVAPDEGGPVDVDLAGDVDLSGVGPAAAGGAEVAGSDDPAAADEPVADEPVADEPVADEPVADEDDGEAAEAASTEAAPPTAEATGDPTDGAPADADDTAQPADDGVAATPTAAARADEPDTAAAVDTGEEYELDAEERAEVEERYGTEFETGNEVAAPGEADIETPGPTDAAEPAADAPVDEAASAETAEPDADAGPAAADPDVQAAADQADESDEPAGDLEDAVVAAMADLDDGDGADHGAVVASVTDDRGVEAAAVEDAIEAALMDGRCYEPADDRLKSI